MSPYTVKISSFIHTRKIRIIVISRKQIDENHFGKCKNSSNKQVSNKIQIHEIEIKKITLKKIGEYLESKR